MSKFFENRGVRPVRVFTEKAVFDGLLTISLGARTIDELNLAARSFLCLSCPSVVSGEWHLADGALLINKASVLFVVEIPDLGAPLGKSEPVPELRQLSGSVIHLRVGSYEIQGYVSTLPGSDPLTRLNHSAGHAFVALTAATLEGKGIDGSVPFVAVSRSHVLLAQEVLSIHAHPDEVAAGVGGASS